MSVSIGCPIPANYNRSSCSVAIPWDHDGWFSRRILGLPRPKIHCAPATMKTEYPHSFTWTSSNSNHKDANAKNTQKAKLNYYHDFQLRGRFVTQGWGRKRLGIHWLVCGTVSLWKSGFCWHWSRICPSEHWNHQSTNYTSATLFWPPNIHSVLLHNCKSSVICWCPTSTLTHKFTYQVLRCGLVVPAFLEVLQKRRM